MLGTYLHSLLVLQYYLSGLWPIGDADRLYDKDWSWPVLAAAVQLDVSVTQFVSRCLDLVPAGATPPTELFLLVQLATKAHHFTDLSGWASGV